MGYRYGYGMMPWGFIFCLILLVFIVIAVYKITIFGKRNASTTINSNAVEILKERYARGEINEEEYKKMRDTIEK